MIPTPEAELDLRNAGWKQMPLAAEIAFFFLTIVAVVALNWFCNIVFLPEGPVVLAVAIGAAEWLIWRYRFWRTGVEAALWIGGEFAFIFWLPSSGKPEALFVLLAAFALAGWRLRNPIFGVIATCFFLRYLEAKHLEPVALMAGLAIGIGAAVAVAYPWKRRSTEWLFSLTAIAAPVYGYSLYDDYRYDALIGIALLFFATAAIECTIGIRTRMRAPLIAGAACVALGCFELRTLLKFADEWKLIGAGVASLAIATALMRTLRGRTSGITVSPVQAHELQEAVQIASMMPMATPDATPDQSGPVSGGGGFGGAGASGDY